MRIDEDDPVTPTQASAIHASLIAHRVVLRLGTRCAAWDAATVDLKEHDECTQFAALPRRADTPCDAPVARCASRKRDRSGTPRAHDAEQLQVRHTGFWKKCVLKLRRMLIAQRLSAAHCDYWIDRIGADASCEAYDVTFCVLNTMRICLPNPRARMADITDVAHELVDSIWEQELASLEEGREACESVERDHAPLVAWMDAEARRCADRTAACLARIREPPSPPAGPAELRSWVAARDPNHVFVDHLCRARPLHGCDVTDFEQASLWAWGQRTFRDGDVDLLREGRVDASECATDRCESAIVRTVRDVLTKHLGARFLLHLLSTGDTAQFDAVALGFLQTRPEDRCEDVAPQHAARWAELFQQYERDLTKFSGLGAAYVRAMVAVATVTEMSRGLCHSLASLDALLSQHSALLLRELTHEEKHEIVKYVARCNKKDTRALDRVMHVVRGSVTVRGYRGDVHLSALPLHALHTLLSMARSDGGKRARARA